MSIEAILEALISRLEAYRIHLEEMLELGHPGLIFQASSLHLSAATDLASFAKEVERGRHGLSWKKPLRKIPLEALERGFFKLREQAEKEAVTAEKLSSIGGKVAREAARAARQSSKPRDHTHLPSRTPWSEEANGATK